MKTIKALAALLATLITAPFMALYRLIADDIADFKALAASGDRVDVESDDDDEIVGVNPATGALRMASGVEIGGTLHED